MRVKMWPDDLDLNVSRESLEKLQQYQVLLFKWQKAINLVSPKTLQESGVRHFADSVQLEQYLPEDVGSVMDWGSGAGFPGAVLAILRPDVEFVVVESDARKCEFMRTVSRETSATLRIENARIEQVVEDCENIPDVITARALKPVKVLLDFAAPLISTKPDLELLLLKGESVDDELVEARDAYAFDVESFPSVTNSLASIIRLRNISIKS